MSHYREGTLDGIPAWDQASYEKTRDAVQALADSWVGLNGFGALGWYDDVDPTKGCLKICRLINQKFNQKLTLYINIFETYVSTCASHWLGHSVCQQKVPFITSGSPKIERRNMN